MFFNLQDKKVLRQEKAAMSHVHAFTLSEDCTTIYAVIAGDGVHPSNPSKFQDYSEESLKSNGYVLRNYLSVMAYAEVIRQVIRQVLQPGK
jgi:hypothetical protein